jgi:fumarate hydratase class I
VNLDTVTREDSPVEDRRDAAAVSGKMLTGRDAAHKKITDMIARGEKLPVDLANRFIYYVGPVDPVRDEAVGPAGPTTATRMDKFTAHDARADRPDRHDRQVRARNPTRDRGDPRQPGRVPDGGGRRGVSGVEGDHRSEGVVAFPELGMEAIYEFEVKDMPVTVAVDFESHHGKAV